ncbi:MAG TPA: peptide chain release factor N(5)-glutamine methyltransferase [Desulfomonilia bacterium]|nr:peptide chain release factor N(5)-glutamine methyltransferase [Desulfomonilia bacterium]
MAATISSVLVHARGLLKEHSIESADIDADILLAHVLHLRRIDLIIHRDRVLEDEEVDIFNSLLGRRLKREPVAYIIGEKEFFGRCFFVNENVLVPRPETEILVEQAIALSPEGAGVFEIGVGSGAVIISLLCERDDLKGFGNDISIETLATARANAESHGVSSRLRLFAGNTLRGLCTSWPVIIANPPYIPLNDESILEDDVRLYEPSAALYGGKDGLVVVRDIMSELSGHLAPGGLLIMEAGQGQKDAIDTVVSAHDTLRVRSWVSDLAGIPRTVIIERMHG